MENTKEQLFLEKVKLQQRSPKKTPSFLADDDSILDGGSPSEDLKLRKSLRSAVITDNDPLKIKLKISKKDIVESFKAKKDSELKSMRNLRNSLSGASETRSDEYKVNEEDNISDSSETKMKLRRRKETEDDQQTKKEGDEHCEEKKRLLSAADEVGIDTSDVSKVFRLAEGERLFQIVDGERATKKRGRPCKAHYEDADKEEGAKRRSRRIEGGEALEQDKMEPSNEMSNGNVMKESFCWTCHKEGSIVKCDTCPRVFHLKCVSLSKDPSKNWICPECSLVLHAETMSTRSEAMKSLTLDQLCTLLGFAIGRMKNVPESQAFWKPVDPKEVPYYDKYITNPMDLNLLERNMKAKMYGSTQAFLADAKWLLHNSIIFNSTQSPLTSTARFLVKICKQEMGEIENCPDCYLNAHTKEDWFVEVCRKPHILVWARLKGFPFWPAKAMSTNFKTQSVDARFFGAHDKAWVPVKECYLYSKNSPQMMNKKRSDLDEAFAEVERYIKKMKNKFGVFVLAPDRTPFLPEMYDKQLESMIPTYKEEKPSKRKKNVGEEMTEENGVVEKTIQSGKKLTEHGTQHRFKLKRPVFTKASDEVKEVKEEGELCLVNDYVTEEKVVSDDGACPEDEIARSLEMLNTRDAQDVHAGTASESVDENSTDLDENSSVPIPEHGYSRSLEDSAAPCSSDNIRYCVDVVDAAKEELEETEDVEEMEEVEGTPERNEATPEVPDETAEEIDGVAKCKAGEPVALTDGPGETGTTANECKKSPEEHNSESCEVSSTSADIRSNENNSLGSERNCDETIQVESNAVDDVVECQGKSNRKRTESVGVTPTNQSNPEGKLEEGSSKREEDRSPKSFTNLTVDQKQKIISEAKLLANIDEMTALGKQKVLNELGLDASQVDIRQLAQENRKILETLNKKGHNDGKTAEEVPIKNEDFEQYLMEESNEDEFVDRLSEQPPPPRLGSIKVRDFHTLAHNKTAVTKQKPVGEPMLKIMDVQSLKDLRTCVKDAKSKRRKSLEDSGNSGKCKKMKLEPVIELIKLDMSDRSMKKLNRNLRLSDEVSLLMVEGDKKCNLEMDKLDVDFSKKPSPKKYEKKPAKARKSCPNRSEPKENPSSTKSEEVTTTKTSPSRSNVISIDTDNPSAQRNILKSLCLEEKRQDEDVSEKCNRKTVLITTNEKGIKNVDVSSNCDLKRKQPKEVPLEVAKETKDSGQDCVNEENGLCQQKNVTVVANSHLILTNNGSAFLNNNQGNLALTQNNLGQLSLVHLTNLTSGIQTNFVNLTNETIGFNNSIGTLYAAPGFNPESYPSVSGSGNGSVLLSPSLATSGSVVALNSATASKNGKAPVESGKLPIPRVGVAKPSGISVKSPASLGLATPQTNKLPPLVAKPGEEPAHPPPDIGSVTAELNRHSIKMAEYMRATIEDILRELANQGSLEAKCKTLTIEMEKLQWRHQQEIMELKHHSERSMMELRTTLESEKQKCLAELRAQLEAQHQKAVSETKHKQWCANCGKEALFYCCWNTSYCDYPCQQQHWPGHMSTCAQLGNNVQTSNQLQSKSPAIKYQTPGYVPVMSRGSGSHTGTPFAGNRVVSGVQGQGQIRRAPDNSGPQIPINITIRPQHYLM